MFTQEFKTKTNIQPKENPKTSKYWGISIDVGYSSVKIYSPNMVASFPSYAKPVEYGTADNAIGSLDRSNIAYRDEEGNEFLVGANAQQSVRISDSDSSAAALYIRNRYSSTEFKVISRVGLALGMTNNQYGDPSGKILHIQTGLPPEYIKADSDDLKEAFAGHHKFSVKLGSGDWMDFEFDIDINNIDVMAQPMGTLISIATDNNGRALPEAKSYLSSNLIIVDPGFGTLDTFEISNHHIRTSKTWNDLGMLRVFQETAKIIENEYDVVIPIPAMQKILQDGYFSSKFDRKTRQTTKIDLEPILKKANQTIAEKAISEIDGFYNCLLDQDYVVITGGTGAAWLEYFKTYYSGIETLQIVNGTYNKDEAIFSNVRGYYMNQLNTLKRRG